jgi:cytochrome c-type biogenesis protein CcmH
MIWAALLILAAAALAPMAISLLRATTMRGRRDAALALHRAQLDELARERDAGRLGPAEHDAAVLEVQRRLLAADAAHDTGAGKVARFPLAVLLPLIPLVGVCLYLLRGVPDMPAQPLAARQATAARQAAEEDALIAELRQRLAGMDPRSAQGRQGFILLGNAEVQRGHMHAGADAWRTALAAGFDPTLAAITAAAMTEAEGKVTKEAADLFRNALATAPPDAPWRPMAEKRLREYQPE